MIGQFFTPEVVAHGMFRLARARPGQRIVDPSCGDGAFLRTAPRGCEFVGCEIDPAWHAALGSGLPNGRIARGDALTSLIADWGTFDLAIGNPPFSGQTHLERREPVLRGFDLGVGRASQCLEVLFLELFVKLVRERGRIAIILPDGPLSNRPFAYVRDWLLCRAHVETIVSLPRGIFDRTSAKTNILVAQRLPLARQPYREPTRLWACRSLAGFGVQSSARASGAKDIGHTAVLADRADWRLEATGDGDELDEGVRLGEVFRLRTGFALYGGRRELFDEPSGDRVALLRAKNLAPGGGLRLDEQLAYIARPSEMFCEASLVRPGELLMVRVGVGCYGRAALVPPGLVAQADDWLHVLTPLRRVDAAGLVQWFHSEEGRAKLSRLAKGVGTLSISKASLAELRIPQGLVQGTGLVLNEKAPPYRVRRRQSAARPAGARGQAASRASVAHPPLAPPPGGVG